MLQSSHAARSDVFMLLGSDAQVHGARLVAEQVDLLRTDEISLELEVGRGRVGGQKVVLRLLPVPSPLIFNVSVTGSCGIKFFPLEPVQRCQIEPLCCGRSDWSTYWPRKSCSKTILFDEPRFDATPPHGVVPGYRGRCERGAGFASNEPSATTLVLVSWMNPCVGEIT